MKLIRHKLREVSSMIVYVNCIIKSYYFCLQHPQTFLSSCILQVMMKVDLEDVTSRQVRRNNIYFDTIESFSLFSLVNILGSRLDYFLFLPCPFHTILDLLMFSFIFSPSYFPLSLSSSNPASFLFFYSTSSNITLLMSQSFLSTLFILFHSILFSSLPTLLPVQSSFPLPFSHLFITPLHTPSHLPCSPYFLLLVQIPHHTTHF